MIEHAGRTAILVTTGVYGDSYPESLLNDALIANTLDLLQITKDLPAVDVQILLTNSKRLIEKIREDFPTIEIEQTEGDFHFGAHLFRIIEEYHVQNLLYFGGGSGVLLNSEDVNGIINLIVKDDNLSLSNNFYSSDFFGVSPASKLINCSLPEKDNLLGWISRDAGLQPKELARSAKTQIDIDSPADLLPLRIVKTGHEHLDTYLSSLEIDDSAIREILPQLTDSTCRLVIAGRIGASTWSYLEENAACHIDVYSEGRGSYATRKNGESLPSLLGDIFEKRGSSEALKTLLARGTALILDTRLLFNYRGSWPTRRERFWSDLLNPSKLKTDYLRDLTEASINHPKPVALGGHSLTSGALYHLVDIAWNVVKPRSKNVKPTKVSLDH